MATVPKVLSYEEWLELPVAEDCTEETIDGDVYRLPPNFLEHARVTTRLVRAIESAVDSSKIEVFPGGFGLVIRRDPVTCLIPDVAVFRKDSIVERDGYVHSAPQFLAEVLSASDRRARRERKLRDYASIGVPEVWFVSPEAAAVQVFHLESGALVSKTIVADGRLRLREFPEVEIDVPSLFPE